MKKHAGFTTETRRHGGRFADSVGSALRTAFAFILSPGSGDPRKYASRPNPLPNPPPEYRAREKEKDAHRCLSGYSVVGCALAHADRPLAARRSRALKRTLRDATRHSDFGFHSGFGDSSFGFARMSRMTFFALILLFAINSAFAQVPAPPKPIVPPPRILKDIGIEQQLDAQVPADLVFKDEEGKDVRLGDYYGKRPIVLTLVYYECPMLCTMVLNDLVRGMRGIGTLNLGQDYDVVTVSFDPKETPKLAAAKKKQYISEYGRLSAANGWHFLTGQQAQIAKLAQTVGFHYAWDDHTNTWAHASGIIVLTPTGKVSRYFYGIDYAPSDLKLSLLEAGKGSISPKAADRILLFCFHYDPRSGKYGLVVTRAIQAGGVLTMLLLGGFIGLNLMREKKVTETLTREVRSQEPEARRR